MEDQEFIVNSILEEVEEQDPQGQSQENKINIDAIGEAMAAAGRR